MNKIFNLPKFHIGQNAYLHYGTGSYFMVKIQDVYRHNAKWYYDVDASSYKNGMELEYVNEGFLTKENYQNPKFRVSTKTLNKLSESI